MNTKYYFDRRLGLTISILLTTLWLPLTSFAQDFTKTEKPENVSDCERSTKVLTAPTVLNAHTLEERVGFSETDPAANIYRTTGEIRHQAFVDCLDGNAKEVALRAPGVS